MNSAATYRIRSHYFPTSAFPLVLRDTPQERLAFHIESGDYFGTLATILGLIADTLSTNKASARTRCIQTLNEMRADLVCLQNSCTIVMEKKRTDRIER